MRILPGLDTRSVGGYTIGPGSSGRLGSYKIEARGEELPQLTDTDLFLLLAHPGIRWGKQKPSVIQDGSRNDTVFRMLCAVRTSVADEKSLLAVATGLNQWCSPSMDQDEVEKIVASVLTYKPQSAPANAQIDADDTAEKKTPVLTKIVSVLRLTPAFADAFAYNLFTNSPQVKGAIDDNPTAAQQTYPRDVNDNDLIHIRVVLTEFLACRVALEDVFHGLTKVSRATSFHSVLDEINSVPWDGKPRVDKLLTAYFGAGDTPYAALVSRCLLISMIARVRDPGCKVDTLVVLESEQGTRKSQGLAALAGRANFADSPLTLGDKDAFQVMRGTWLYEIQELVSLRSKSAEQVKAFLSSPRDRYRPSFGRLAETVARQTVFVATTNEEFYLRDPTGNRRYLPLAVTNVDPVSIADDRLQLFAEAQARYDAGEPWWPDSEADISMCSTQQETRVQVDPWTEIILNTVRNEDSVDASRLMSALGLAAMQRDKSTLTKLGILM